jgi:DNA processing protein
MSPEEKLARIKLNNTLPSSKALAAIHYFGSAETAIRELGKQLSMGYTSTPKAGVVGELKDALVFGEEGYPNLLSEIPDPPLVLYYRGNASVLQKGETILALVGTRKPSEYGAAMARLLTEEAVVSGYSTVSGLAFGIDAIIHEHTIDLGGKTIAVIGTAIDDPYPRANRYLYDRIVSEGGVVVSELYTSQPYQKWVFPKRNRIIAALAENTIVIEAALKSGALITARLAEGYSRRVFAVPGQVFSANIQGNLELLMRQSAEMIRHINDINSPGIPTPTCKDNTVLNFAQESLLENINTERDIFTLQRDLGWEDRKFLQLLGELEISGKIKVMQGMVRRLA